MEAITLWNTGLWNSTQWRTWLSEGELRLMPLIGDERLLAASKAHKRRWPCCCTSVKNATPCPRISPLCWSLLCYTWSARVYQNVAWDPAATGTAAICAADALSVFPVMLSYGGSGLAHVSKRLKTVWDSACWAVKSRGISVGVGEQSREKIHLLLCLTPASSKE